MPQITSFERESLRLENEILRLLEANQDAMQKMQELTSENNATLKEINDKLRKICVNTSSYR